MKSTLRWFGPSDPVSLNDIRQCGCEGVITSLHHIAYGEVWPRHEIAARKQMLAEYGLEWTAVESVPVSEEIKLRNGNYVQHIENYKETLRNLAAEGLDLVIYNFMPVLDWVRTDMAYRLPDGTESLYYDPVHFAAFEIYLLKRPGAEQNCSPEQLKKAEQFFQSLDPAGAEAFEKTIIDVFPGVSMGLTLQDIRDRLAKYDGIDHARLQNHLKCFLQEVIPVCEETGIRMAIHPDDPPFSILGLPRIVSCEADIQALLAMADSPANGVCCCAGSFSARGDNDLPGMIRRYGSRFHVFHLRSTQRNADGSFYEASHLGGSVDMYAVVKEILLEMKRRKEAGRSDWRLAFRPDHGLTMLDDLRKPPLKTPGYHCIGRLRGLSEIRGLQLGISRSLGI
ncbi:MAG: mannonate dehydratase [Pontiellaceae bacterium]|jgi:mannonate dehydratase|nr:mannonate dehydratase [Pontiellaceae bacterium]